MRLQEIDIGETRTFRSQKSKRAANARLHEDGSVSGLFQIDDQVVKIEGSAKAGKHDVSIAQLPEVGTAPKRVQQGDIVMLGIEAGHHPHKEHPPSVDSVNIHANKAGAKIAEDPADLIKGDVGKGISTGTSHGVPTGYGKVAAKIDPTWQGVRFFPNCYRGDNKEHTFIMNIEVDKPAVDSLGP